MSERPFSDLPDAVVQRAIDRASVDAYHASEREVHGEDGTGGRAAADVLIRLLSIVAGDRGISRTTERLIGRNVILLLWLCRPDAMVGHVGHPLSLRGLAKLLEVSPATLTANLVDLQQSTGLENPFTRSHGRHRRAERRQGGQDEADD